MSRLSSWVAARSESTGEVGLSVVLGLQVVIMFVLAPLAAMRVLPQLTLDTARMALAAAAVLLLARSRYVSMAIIVTFIASVLLSSMVKSSGAATIIELERFAALTAFDLAVAWAVAKVVYGQGKVNAHRIMGAVILYLSIALVFANVYRACALLLEPAFSGLQRGTGTFLSNSLYFSISTLTTAGYGDIIPAHPLVRSIANLEAVIGQLFPATLLARLVTLHAATESDRPPS
jgi:voltage-gated potassium channel Kch